MVFLSIVGEVQLCQGMIGANLMEVVFFALRSQMFASAKQKLDGKAFRGPLLSTAL